MTKKTSQSLQIPRRERSKFRPTFKDRCIFMFSKTGTSLFQLDSTDLNKYDSPKIGMSVLASYKYLSNSIEMLCKATLEQVSPFLLLEKIDDFSKSHLSIHYARGQRTCGGQIALARASKLFRCEITPQEYSILEKIIEKRNHATHSEFFIKDFRGETTDLLTAMEILRKIFDNQFRDANILKSAQLYIPSFEEDYEELLEKYSQEFLKMQKKVKRLSKTFSFMTCFSCTNPFAKMVRDTTYKCLWCDDVKYLHTCSRNSCSNKFWTSSALSELCNSCSQKQQELENLSNNFIQNTNNQNLTFLGLLNDLSVQAMLSIYRNEPLNTAINNFGKRMHQISFDKQYPAQEPEKMAKKKYTTPKS